ncbi:MAG: Crp/Fnr family transcriptional regulator [Vicinamibacteria bacterium]|nr:Crp/Fnr family transcriptional regulator [Vicinamibacteria bacterium]
MTDRELLLSVPIFSELTPAELESLARVCSRRQCRKNGVVLYEKDPGDTLFVIVSGRVKVGIQGDDGREVILSVIGPGEFFGEMALLDDEPRSATAVATEDCELLTLSRADFQQVIQGHSSILAGLVRVLSARLRRANSQISTLALLDVYGRVARVLVDMAREEGKRLKDGRISFRRATHQEIANRIGTTRETVTRMLKDLERQHLLEVTPREMVVGADFEKAFEASTEN